MIHVVFTKLRRKTIRSERDRLYDYIGGIIHGEKGVLIEIGGMPDHIHILAKLHPTRATSDVLRIVNANSSKWFTRFAPRPSVVSPEADRRTYFFDRWTARFTKFNMDARRVILARRTKPINTSEGAT